MYREDMAQILIGISNFLREPFHLSIYNVEIGSNYIKIHLQESDYKKEELFELITKHLPHLKFNYKSCEPYYETEYNDEDEPTGNKFYKHTQLMLFFEERG